MNTYECNNYEEGGKCSISNEKIPEDTKRKYCISTNHTKCPKYSK